MAEYGAAQFGSPSFNRPWHKQSEEDATKGSEYGGVEGLIAPFPHDVKNSASEQLSLMFNTDPADEMSGADLPPSQTVRKYTG